MCGTITPGADPRQSPPYPRQWAADLALFSTPTLVFFDVHGKEILRIDSVVQFFRLAGVLRYVAEKAYQEHPAFQHWKFAQSKAEQEAFSRKPNDALR